MDEDFQGFLDDFGPAFDRVYVPKSSMERYRGRLPDQLLSYWDDHGWCGYADGMFWTVNPQDYEPALEAWIAGTEFMRKDKYHVIARSAFGNMYLWGERTGFTLKICPIGSYAVPFSERKSHHDKLIQIFFGVLNRRAKDFAGYFDRALKELGRLKADEIYGFVPAIAMGGSAKFENLQKVKAVEHLVFLAQLSELQVMVTAYDKLRAR